MKVTLIGRPEKIETRQQCVVFKLQGRPPGALPRGLPAPAQPPLSWVVWVAAKQWSRVQASLNANQEDQVIIEGYPAQQGNQLVLLAQSVTSVALQRAKKAQQSQAETATA